MFSLSKKLFLWGALAFFSVNPGAQTVRAIEYGGLGISPNASEVSDRNPLTKAWFIYTVSQGGIKSGKVDIVNTSDEKMDIRVYPVDAVTTSDGAFAPESEDKEKTGVGAWTSLDASDLSLEPGEKKTVDFTIHIPSDAEVGDHMGAIIAQGKSGLEEMRESGMRVSTRVGARMYITVPGEIVEKLTFDEFAQETRDDGVDFHATFSNHGNVRIRMKGIIEIKDSDGLIVDTVDIPEREVFPRKSITIPVAWRPENTTGGRFSARAIVEYGTNRQIVRESVFSVSPRDTQSALTIDSSLGVGIGIGLAAATVLLGLLALARRTGKRHGMT